MLALPVAVQVFMRGRGVTEVPAVLATSLVLCAAMGLATWSLGVEIAGVLGGLAVIVVLGLGAGGTAIFGKLWAASRMWPYAALVVVAVAQKLVIPVLAARGLLPILSTSRLAWSVLSSPGLALLTAALLASRSNVDSALLVAVGRRAWRPVVATALFLVAARILIEAGGTKALADAAGGLPAIPALVSVGLFGAISGFLTGSGISGNALFMPSAAAIGTSFGNLPVFAALQSAAAGHTALASLPIAAVLLATLPERSKADDRTAMSLGLSIAGANLALLVAWSATLLWAGH